MAELINYNCTLITPVRVPYSASSETLAARFAFKGFTPNKLAQTQKCRNAETSLDMECPVTDLKKKALQLIPLNIIHVQALSHPIPTVRDTPQSTQRRRNHTSTITPHQIPIFPSKEQQNRFGSSLGIIVILQTRNA